MAVQTNASSSTSNAEVTFPVTGMTCASCVRRIEKALTRVDGVQEASVNLATERAKVLFDPSLASADQMRAAVARAGYAAGYRFRCGRRRGKPSARD
jgi:Cu+-exporting ATPase